MKNIQIHSCHFLSFLFFLCGLNASAQTAIDINLNVKHTVGGISEFDRSKFITIHSEQTDNEWFGDNFTNDLLDDFMNGYDVYFGRNTGGISWILSQVAEDPDRPGYASIDDMKARGQIARNNYKNKQHLHPYEARNNLVIGAQLHPFWPDGKATGQGWALSGTDTPEEPFGSATAEYMGHYINEFFAVDAEPFPLYVEVINEPLYGLVTHGSTPPDKIFNYHVTIAEGIRALNKNVKIGGYTTAFPDFEKNNFQRWEERDKLFMDIAGGSMDFWSIHLYDFPAFGGKQLLRSGSNVEATFDMMEQYSQLSFNEVKPFMISEYGAQVHSLLNKPWSPYRDWLQLKSLSSMLMNFLERPNNMVMSIPFIIPKALWGATDVPYNHRLMRQKFEADGETGNHWVYSEMVKFYQLWSNVNGTRVDTKSTDLDIQADAYVDNNKAYVILNNLNFEPEKIDLHLLGWEGNTIQSVTAKHLLLAGDSPVLDTKDFTTAPGKIELDGEATMILEYTFTDQVVINETSMETKYYADAYYKPIVSNNAEIFNINGVSTGTHGEAVLRLGLGRDHYRSLQPVVNFNNTPVEVPINFRGYDQASRDRFFGVIEIPISYDLLQENNTISIEFSDDGGHISSVAMQAFEFSQEIARIGGSSAVTATKDLDLNSQIQVYPNPATKAVTLSLPANQDVATVSIIDMNGKTLFAGEIGKEDNMLDMSSFSAGIYLLNVQINKEINHLKLIIE